MTDINWTSDEFVADYIPPSDVNPFAIKEIPMPSVAGDVRQSAYTGVPRAKREPMDSNSAQQSQQQQQQQSQQQPAQGFTIDFNDEDREILVIFLFVIIIILLVVCIKNIYNIHSDLKLLKCLMFMRMQQT